MTDELDRILPPLPATTRCAHCGGPLPAPIEQLAVVHGADGEILTACSIGCLAELLAALAGRPGIRREAAS